VDFLFGWGMGLGSNTVFSLYDYNLEGSYIADNTLLFLLGSYGILGVLLCLTIVAGLTWKLRSDAAGLALAAAFFLQLMVVQVMEIYPVNVLAMLMFGLRLAVVEQQSLARQTLLRKRVSAIPELA